MLNIKSRYDFLQDNFIRYCKKYIDILLSSNGINLILPSQENNAGKFYKTDGTNASWTNGSYRIVGEDYTTVLNDRTIECTGSCTINLITSVGNTSKFLRIINTSLGKVFIKADGIEVIGNRVNALNMIMLYSEESIDLKSNNNRWRIV